MSSGKVIKQHEDTTADAALLALHLTQRETTLLFVMTVRHGATDSQIAGVGHEGLPPSPL